MHSEYQLENLKGNNDEEHIGIDNRVKLKLILMKGVMIWTETVWIRSSCGPL